MRGTGVTPGRDPAPSPSGEPRVRLRRTVEAFEASDGNVYFLRGAAEAEFVVRDAAAAGPALLGKSARGLGGPAG